MKTNTDKKFEINADTKLFCIFGNPIKHSLSPIMQNAAFRELDINAVYVAFETTGIKNAISAMKALNISGASVTIPFKNDALQYVDNVNSLAKEIGSINTLHNDKGIITGYNTDGYGALKAILDNNTNANGSQILLLGNGGSARAIAFTLLQEGAKIIIAGRNISKITQLVNDIKKEKKEVDSILIKDITIDFMQKIDIIINTTPIGMSPNIDITPIDENLLLKKHTVFDIVYSPDITRLLDISKKKSCKIIRGIEMLINQGAKQFEIWTGEKAPVSVMETAVKKYI